MGEKQVEATVIRLRDVHITKIIASPLKRTIQTAQAIAKKHNLPVNLEPSILETNHGVWEGTNATLIRELWPDIYNDWKEHPSGVIFPRGEAFVDTYRRVHIWWVDFLENIDSGTTVVVTNDNIIRALLVNLLEKELDAIWEFNLQPTGITHIAVESGSSTVLYINDTCHLDGLQANLAKHAL